MTELNQVGLVYAGSLDQVIFSDGHVMFFDALFMRRGRRTDSRGQSP